jgi:hypothetical protein
MNILKAPLNTLAVHGFTFFFVHSDLHITSSSDTTHSTITFVCLKHTLNLYFIEIVYHSIYLDGHLFSFINPSARLHHQLGGESTPRG